MCCQQTHPERMTKGSLLNRKRMIKDNSELQERRKSMEKKMSKCKLFFLAFLIVIQWLGCNIISCGSETYREKTLGKTQEKN